MIELNKVLYGMLLVEMIHISADQQPNKRDRHVSMYNMGGWDC